MHKIPLLICTIVTLASVSSDLSAIDCSEQRPANHYVTASWTLLTEGAPIDHFRIYDHPAQNAQEAQNACNQMNCYHCENLREYIALTAPLNDSHICNTTYSEDACADIIALDPFGNSYVETSGNTPNYLYAEGFQQGIRVFGGASVSTYRLWSILSECSCYTFNTITGTQTPLNPKNLKVDHVSLESISISWEPSDTLASEYLVSVSEGKAFSSEGLNARCEGNMLSTGLDDHLVYRKENSGLNPETFYYFRVCAKNQYGTSTASEIVVATPMAFLTNYPNPFSSKSGTIIEFGLKDTRLTVLRIYDVKGRLIRTLLEKNLSEGLKRITFDGKDSQGLPVKSGVYFLKLFSVGKPQQSKKIIVIN